MAQDNAEKCKRNQLQSTSVTASLNWDGIIKIQYSRFYYLRSIKQNERKLTEFKMSLAQVSIREINFVSHHVCCERTNLRKDGKSSRYLAQSSVVRATPAV